MVFFNFKKNDVDLTKDILNNNIENYDKFWDQIISYLKSDEPTTRFFALNYIIRIKDRLLNVLTNQNIAIKLFNTIFSISTADENEKFRDLALYLLPLCINYNTSDHFKKLVFQRILTEFLKYFPKDLSNDQKVEEFINEISSPEIQYLKKYIYLLRDLSNIFTFSDANHPSFQAYVDQLFVILLNQNINIYIQSEVLYNLYTNYLVTNGNRLRFERFLRNPIIKLGKQIKTLSSLYYDEDSLKDSASNQVISNSEASRKNNKNNESTQLIPPDIKYWRSQYYAVWKVWFLRPTDNDILLSDCSQLSTAGYAIKRREQLFKYVRQNNDGSLEAKLEVELPYKLDTTPSMEYFTNKIEEEKFYSDRRNRNKILIKESDNEKMKINTLDEINESLRKKNEYFTFKPVPLQINDILSLEVEMDNKTIIFDQFPFIKKFFLKNKSFSKVKYQFQAFPSETFKIEPSYGELLPKKKVQITVKFIYNNKTFNSSSNINGFIRLRNIRGFPIERINLICMSFPSIKINTNELDFGMISPNTERINFFVIKNLKREKNECNIFILEKEYSPIFKISEKKVVIDKVNSKIITLSVTSKKLGNINCRCVVTTKMGEIYFIKLKALCGYSISIDKKINFGPTDIYYRTSSKRLTIENKDPLYPLSVPLIPSSNEIIINDNQQVILHPNEKKQVKIDFNSIITGPRNEVISINNPISEVNEINIHSISGPIVLIPIFDEIGFPLTFPFTEVSIYIPLINVINEKAKCLISIPKNTPFNISLADNETAIIPYNNQDNTAKGLCFEIKENSTLFIKVTYCGWTQGLYRSNLNFELITPYKLHLYTIILSACCISKSRKSYDVEKLLRIRNFFNNRYDCPPFKGTEPENIETLYKDHSSKTFTLPSQFTVISKKIFMEEDDEAIKEEKLKKLLSNNEENKNNEENNTTNLRNSGIIVTYKNEKDKSFQESNEADDLEYEEYEDDFEDENNNNCFSTKLYNNILILKSKSEVDQTYHIFISGPFTTDIPLDGVVKPYSYLYIPLYIDYKRFSNIINRENFYYTCYGHISIMDENNYAIGNIFTLLQGFNNTMIDFEVGKTPYNPTTIEFPITKQNEKAKKTIYLRNKTNYEIEYNLELKTIENIIYKKGKKKIEYIKRDENQINKSEEDIFKINKTNTSNIIKPFEIVPLEIACLSSSMGSFKSILKVSYNSPNVFNNPMKDMKKEDDDYASYYTDISNQHILDAQFKAPSLIFSCIVGEPEIGISNKLLYFDDISIGKSYTKSIFITNNGNPVNFDFYSLPPYHIEESKLILKQNESKTNKVSFEGKQAGKFNSYIILKYGNNLDFIPVSTYCGKMKIKSNIGKLIKNTDENNIRDSFWEHADLALDFNYIEFSKFKSMELTIYNKGSVDFSLIDIVSSDENIITWHIKEDEKDNNNIIFNSKLLMYDNKMGNMSEYYRNLEFDWDEIAYIMEKQNNNSKTLIKKKENDKSNFPIILLPNESVKLVLTAWGNKEGKFREAIKFFTTVGSNSEIYTLHLKGDISNSLSMKTKSVEFGIVHVNKVGEIQQISFNNESNRSVKWWIDYVETKYNILDAKKRKEDKETFSSVIHPFQIFPDKGDIGAKKSQKFEIKFIPNIPQCDMETRVVICTNIFDKLPFRLHGIGGSVILKQSVKSVDFGCCGVGSKLIVPITISNAGLIYSKFTTECTSSCFKADPEFGVIKNGETIIIRLTYMPTATNEVNKGYFKLIPDNSSVNKIIYISLTGSSGYPDIVINKKMIDFGYTVWRGKNVKTLVIKNKGTVPGVLNFSSKHPSLSIEEIDESDNIVIEPKSKRKIHIVYVPTKMEILNSYGIFSNIKYKTESLLVNFKGIVCQPKLVIDPPDFYETINYGICHINNEYEKAITLSNEGTIDLNYDLKFDFEEASNNNSDIESDDDDDDCDDEESNNNNNNNNNNEDIENIEDKAKLYKKYDCPFKLVNSKNSLSIGQKKVIILKFTPTENINYSFNYSLNYGFQPICGTVNGIGGICKIDFFPKVDLINFGLCRDYKETIKKIYIKNTGNISGRYIIRPVVPGTSDEIYKKDIETLNNINTNDTNGFNIDDNNNNIIDNENIKDPSKLSIWEQYLNNIGLKLLNFDGICNPNEEKPIEFIYQPESNTNLNVSFKLFTKSKSKEITLLGKSGKSILKLYDMDDKEITYKKGINFGMRSVNTLNKIYIKLKNIGDFAIDFMINKSIKNTFEVYPENGFIPPNNSFILTVCYFPKEENIFKWNLNIMWEKGIIRIPIHAKSGTGKIDVIFPETYEDNVNVIKENNKENTYLMKFNPIPVNSSVAKKFYIYNSGIVGVDVDFNVTGEAYTIALTSEVQKYNENKIGTITFNKSGTTNNNIKYDWKKDLNIFIPSHNYVEISCKYYAENEYTSKEKIFISSNCYRGKINLTGKGGTVILSHTGNIEFNDINAKYTYMKSLVIKNTGSIDTKVYFKWTMASHKHYKIISPGKIQFTNSFDNDDPRSEVIRNYIIVRNKIKSNSKEIQMSLLDENKRYDHFKKSKMFYWEIIRLNILSRYFDNDSDCLIKYIDEYDGDKALTNFVKSFKTIIDLMSKHRYKRKKNLYKNIENTPITSQSLSNIQSYMRVNPEEILLPANQSVTVNVDLNLEYEMDYIATLHCISNFSVINEHLIPLIANPKNISVLCNMNKIDFNIQGIGETEVITKEFKNIGSKDFNYSITSNNKGLKIVPDEGILKKGDSINVKFIFQPIDEHIQSFPIIFQPEYSQPIRLQFFGAGGYPQISLKNGSTYEFGNCVIGKKLDVYLPIENKGTAVLKINGVLLYSNGTFSEGPDWPNERIFIQPKETYRLPLVFKPENENPPPATVSLITPLENYEINLNGVGKDAMIIISSLYLEFNDCIIGNQYEQKVTIRNTGDVIYPVQMEYNDILPGIKFSPDKFQIMPYSSFEVGIQFKPTVEINKNIFVDVNSPYSKNQIRLKLHSGYVNLMIEKSVFNFGMFELNSTPKIKFNIKNVGTIGTHYSIVHRGNNSNIQFTNRTGFIKPNEISMIKMTYVNSNKHFGPFSESFDIKSDLFDSYVAFKVIGDCNHALIHPQEINNIDLGLCPIFEYTKKNIILKNYGKFPLTYKLKVVYPIQCNVSKGTLNGNESQVIRFSWIPTGGYMLHSTATLSSNAGNYTLSIVGKGTLPKINISTNKIDYGICAMNCVYEKTLTIVNVGLVKFKWNIQQQNHDFELSMKEGELNVSESVDIVIKFTPKYLKCYQSILYLECKGLTSREIQLIGIGGTMKFYISPRIINMGICPNGLLTTGSFTIKSKGEVTVYTNFSEGKRSNPNNILMAPKSVILPPGKSEECKFDILPNDEGQFEYRLVISTKEKTYRIKIIGMSKNIQHNQTVLKILDETNQLVEMDPLKNYEQNQKDIFEVQINGINKKIYEDKEIFEIIEDKVNEIKYYFAGSKDYLKASSSQVIENRNKIYKSNGKKRFSVFKTPIVIANIPTIKRNNKSLVSISKGSTIIKNCTIEEIDKNIKNSDSLSYIKEKIFNKNKTIISKINNTPTDYDNNTILKNSSFISDADVIKSHTLLTNPSITDNQNSTTSNIKENVKRSTSENILLLNSSTNESNAIKYSDSKKSTIHESLISLNKKILDSYNSNNFLKEKCDISDLSIPYIKDDKILIANEREMLMNKLLQDDTKNEGFSKNTTAYSNSLLTRSGISSIYSFKDRLLNKKVFNIEEKKEFINQIKKDFINYKINKSKIAYKNEIKYHEDDSVIESIINSPIPKINNNNIEHIIKYVTFDYNENLDKILSRPLPFNIENIDTISNKVNIKSVSFNGETSYTKKRNLKNLQFRKIDSKYEKIYENNMLLYIPKSSSSSTKKSNSAQSHLEQCFTSPK
ncbi:hypothetical protein BCR36DRAFT_411476 [Piromyces finnis]|uniref:HYDIN/VesB/CFA65-like Ig-like domain-containing protein n=1 Tax=Piromyces finnis TaxID=1754191 RepID=A0A1Y1VD39_9FUNG|nr:hypothetical protein BCR36DRAFT_411476 [Piromyces finnis]|eukprot:ORX52588.1 hypothetical protein BCR36DRAFT_411476 [Piromyces finnis]